HRLTCLTSRRLSAALLTTACVSVSLGCSSGGGGGPTPLGAAGMRWMPGTGNVAGEIGAGGAGGARAFPTQACVDKATERLWMRTGEGKIAQLHQVERADATARAIPQYGVGSICSQGGSGPATNTPTGWADMIDGFRM